MSSVEKLVLGDRRLVQVDGTAVGVFNLDGEYYALQNTCPHQYGPVCRGNVRPAIDADRLPTS